MIQREQGPIPEEYQLWKPCDIEGQPWCVLDLMSHSDSPISNTPSYRHLVSKEIGKCSSTFGGSAIADFEEHAFRNLSLEEVSLLMKWAWGKLYLSFL